ncbi:MAG TPA: tyrosine-type recombinase/integrase [Treponemataceae bacterium]|nr:tyrosine-type recombinase/integrase [Treponemataceae bacterium]
MRLTSSRVRAMWEAHVAEKGLAPATVKTYKRLFRDLSRFVESAHGSGWDWREISRDDGVAYAEWLEKRGWSYTSRRLSFKAGCWIVKLLWQRKRILTDAWHGLEMKYRKNAVRLCLDEDEVRAFLESIPIDDLYSLRDRALFELMYSSGLRPGEACRVRRDDIDAERRMIVIRKSKFAKDRVVPVTEPAMRALSLLMEVRKGDYLFGIRGRQPLSYNVLASRFRARYQAAGFTREGIGPHSLRHSCARHLLAHGADIRYVQRLLGHESIETTVVYTYEQTEQVKKTYRRYHPREGILYREVDDDYLARIAAFRATLEPLFTRRLTRRPKTTGDPGKGVND